MRLIKTTTLAAIAIFTSLCGDDASAAAYSYYQPAAYGAYSGGYGGVCTPSGCYTAPQNTQPAYAPSYGYGNQAGWYGAGNGHRVPAAAPVYQPVNTWGTYGSPSYGTPVYTVPRSLPASGPYYPAPSMTLPVSGNRANGNAVQSVTYAPAQNVTGQNLPSPFYP